jgi:Domain of unknown function (DUF4386)
MENDGFSIKKTARLAGLLYLGWIVIGLFGMFYIPSQISLRGDATTVSASILSHEFLFRLSIIAGLITSTIWVIMVLVFYRLFKSVNGFHARLLVALVIVQIPTVFVTESFNIASLSILRGDILPTFELNQRQNLALLFLRISDYGVLALEFFWGLWLFPLALLTYHSGFLPRFLGVWLAINGVAYLVLSFVSIVLPVYKSIVFNMAIPAMFGELVFVLWILIRGIKQSQVNRS